MANPASVAIVGFGPAGMFLAGLLGVRGIDVIVLERAEDVFPLPRAAHLDHTALRVLQELGLADRMLTEMVPNSALVLADADLRPLATIPASATSRSGYPASLYFYQPDFDRIISETVSAMPTVTVLRGVEMLDFTQNDDGVVIRGREVGTGEEVTISSDWLVGCDGSWSPVREALGIPLSSLNFDEQWLVLDLKFDGPHDHVPDHALQVCDPQRPWVSNPVPGGRYRVEVKLFEDDDHEYVTSVEFLSEFLRPLLGDTRFWVERRGVYTFHGLIADRWRDGRVLIAGDAAHQMPPFLGQGMCSGIRDAVNLAWKLAAVVRGEQPAVILDTYESERAPHARSIVASAIQVGSFVSVSDADAVAARNEALRSGRSDSAPTFRLPEIGRGDLVADGGGMQFPQPFNAIAGKPVLDAALGHGFAVISIDPFEESQLVDRWRNEWSAVTLTVDSLGPDGVAVRSWLDRIGAKVVVVRPDRYIYFAGEVLPDPPRLAVAAR